MSQSSGLALLRAMIAAHPGTFTLAGKTIARAAIVESRGMMEDAKGGFVQGRKVRVMCDFAALREADVMDSTTGLVMRQTLTATKRATATSYRVKRVTHDAERTFWSIEAEQAVT